MDKRQWYTVPAGTREAECRACKATIFWITTPRGAKMPIDCEPDGGMEPTAKDDGSGVSHFLTCTDPNRFSGQGRTRD